MHDMGNRRFRSSSHGRKMPATTAYDGILSGHCAFFQKSSLWKKLFFFMGGVGLLLTFVAPFLWMIATSLKSNQEMFSALEPGHLFLPPHPRWRNYQEIFTSIPFGRYLLNSFGVAVSSALLETSLSAMAAYGLAMIRWRQERWIRRLLFLSWLIPFSVVLIPRFLLIVKLPELLWPSDFWEVQRVIVMGDTIHSVGRLAGLNSFFSLIVPGSVSITATFLLITAMERVPSQVAEAAYLETGSHLRVFWDIMLPLVKPTWVTACFIAFLSSWQSFTWPLIVTTSSAMQTAPLGLRAFQTLHSTQWPLLMAGSVILTLPSLLFLLAAQRFVIDRYTVAELSTHKL